MLIIDGYNFLNAMFGLEHSMPIRDMQAARIEMQDRLVRYRNISGAKIRVVYDARGVRLPNEDYSGVEIVCAPASSNADDHIVRTVQGSPRPAGITVVTSDRDLGDRVKKAGGRVMLCKAFYRQMLAVFEQGAAPVDDKAHEKPTRPDPDEVDYFLRRFGDDTRGKK